MGTFLIVHGAWTGAWSWDAVSRELRSRGHDVFVPTLSGLGERAHLSRHRIDLDDHIADVVGEARLHDLEDITLVAHSYGGFVALGAMEALADRVRSIVFVEAFLPESGTSFEDAIGEKYEGDVVPPPDDPDAKDDANAGKVTPQPAGTFRQPVHHRGAWKRVPRKVYVVATGWEGAFTRVAAPFRGAPDWTVHELPCGHDVPLEMPEALADLLESSAGSA